MADLKEQIEESAAKLQNAWTTVQAASGTALPIKTYEYWTEISGLHHSLAATSRLFSAREMAWGIVKGVPTNTIGPNSNLVMFGEIEIDFSVARHLALTSYVAVTWSIYDRLANVCGRLSGVTSVSNNPKQNPKVFEDFLHNKKNILGFGTQFHIQRAYAWPLKVSYKVRNWLVHEGYEEGSTPMFKSDLVSDGYELHGDAVSYLEGCCDYQADSNGKIETCCLEAREEVWPRKDLIVILEKYHSEIDLMYLGLVKWSVDSFAGQITSFAERDMPKLIPTAGGQ